MSAKFENLYNFSINFYGFQKHGAAESIHLDADVTQWKGAGSEPGLKSDQLRTQECIAAALYLVLRFSFNWSHTTHRNAAMLL
jgi:hypothetical protein